MINRRLESAWATLAIAAIRLKARDSAPARLLLGLAYSEWGTQVRAQGPDAPMPEEWDSVTQDYIQNLRTPR